LSKTNTGTLVVAGPASSDFTTVNVDGGTLDVGVAGSIGGVVTTMVADGATLNVGGDYAGSTGDDVLALNDGADPCGFFGTLDGGAHSGEDTVVLNNAATLTGTQSYGGGTTLAGGELVIGGSLSTPIVMMPAKDTAVLAAMKELSAQYPRYGYRRIRVFLRRRGFELSWSRTHRLWCQAGLLVPRKRPHKRIASVRPRIHTPFKANMVWAYDFVFDTAASGQQIKCLTVVDEYTRECLAIDVAEAVRSKRVIEVLSRLVSLHGAPLFMRSDNGPEFVSQAILEWISGSRIATVLNDLGKLWQNCTDESFNGKFRDECLSIEWFRSRREAAVF